MFDSNAMYLMEYVEAGDFRNEPEPAPKNKNMHDHYPSSKYYLPALGMMDRNYEGCEL